MDGKTIEDIERDGVAPFLTGLVCELREKTYQPGAAGVHPEGQRKARASGNPHCEGLGGAGRGQNRPRTCFEAGFQENSYGFRPGKSTHDAVAEIVKWLNYGLEQVIDADL